jgi:parvulin-like peptidyl-prolyl isomerase
MKGRLLVAFLLSLAVLVSGCGGGGGASETAADDVATVGDIHISQTRFTDTLARFRASMAAQKQKFPKEGTTEYEALKSQAIWLLVLEAAREREADKLGIEVTDQEITARIDALKKGEPFNGKEAKFQAELKKQGITEAELRQLYKAIIVSEKLTPHITEDLSVGDDAVHDYFVQNKAQYAPTREVQEILVGKNKEKLANQLYQQLKDGASFAKLAKKYSQDPGSKDQGGNFTARKGETVPNFDKTVFSMKTGELAKPFNTPEYGWFIVKALKPIKKTTEKDVAEQIRQQLLAEKGNEAYTAWSSDLARKVCTSDAISYQIGYTPNPDPCAQYTAPATETAQ